MIDKVQAPTDGTRSAVSAVVWIDPEITTLEDVARDTHVSTPENQGAPRGGDGEPRSTAER